MEDDFRVGNTVRLISGGPIMTVSNVGGDLVACMWFDKAAAVHKETFRREALQPEKIRQAHKEIAVSTAIIWREALVAGRQGVRQIGIRGREALVAGRRSMQQVGFNGHRWR